MVGYLKIRLNTIINSNGDEQVSHLLLISRVTKVFFFQLFYCIERELHALRSLDDKFWIKLIFDVLVRVFRFSKVSFNALASSFIIS